MCYIVKVMIEGKIHRIIVPWGDILELCIFEQTGIDTDKVSYQVISKFKG